MANAKNLASGTLVNSISASETSLTVFVGNGSTATITGVWPTAPFYATILPSQPVAGVANYLDSEIVYVTSVSTDGSGNTVLTVSRGQRATTAKTFSAGAIVTCAVYADDATLLGGVATPETPTPWVTSDDITFTSISSTPQKIGSVGNRSIYRIYIEATGASSVNTWKELTTLPSGAILFNIGGYYMDSTSVNYYPVSNQDLAFYYNSTIRNVSERHTDSYFNNVAVYLTIDYTL